MMKAIITDAWDLREILLPEQEPIFHVTHVMFPGYFCSIFNVTWYFSLLAQNRSRDNRGSGSGLAESPFECTEKQLYHLGSNLQRKWLVDLIV